MRITKLILLTAVLYSFLFASSVLAAEDTPSQEVAGKPAGTLYPFVAEVTGSNVYVRSGKSTADYPTTKLSKPDKVTVVGEEYGWAAIIPPRGSYSWIYKAYVKIEPDNPMVGIVTHENVRVWAGADGIDAGRSMGFQTKMNKDSENIDDDDVVELRPDQPATGEYYKIKPPAGAYLWVSTEFLNYVGPYEQDKPIVIPPRQETKEVVPVDQATQPSGQQPRATFTNLGEELTDTGTPVKVEVKKPEDAASQEPVKPVVEEKPAAPQVDPKVAEYIKQCHEAAETINAELDKPLEKQNYKAVKGQLIQIKDAEDAGKAKVFAETLLERIASYEMVLNVGKAIEQQNAQLEKIRRKIDKAHQEQLEKVPAAARYLYIGTLKESAVYTGDGGPKRYILSEKSGKIACYVIAGTPEVDAVLQKHLGQIVGVNGGIVSSAKSITAVISAYTVGPVKP
ncbi:MAG: SH3 domain-containing protein [Planctomycetota bacterium]|jgi:hypothetical protein